MKKRTHKRPGASVLKKFREKVWRHYREHGRDLPWRRTRDPYKILVSEMMLQQTQVLRVVPKYESFLKKFSTAQALVQAKLSDVLAEWQGLGYNRRALFLKRCAETVVRDFAGKFPRTFDQLCELPGIGPATAGDLMLFAWNEPVPVIETNVRSVFIHEFFPGTQNVSDKQILPLVQKVLELEMAPKSLTKNPREWYWALFDYGTHVKQIAGENPGRRSAHHAKQSRFVGSYRQKRAAVLRELLLIRELRSTDAIKKKLNLDAKTMATILADLERDGFARKVGANTFAIAESIVAE